MRGNRSMTWRKSVIVAGAKGCAALVLAGVLSGSRASADPIALLAGQVPSPASSFSLDFGAFGGVSSALISQTDFALEVDADLGTAQFTQYQQSVAPLVLPGGFSTGNIRVEVVPGSSTGTLDVLSGEFTTSEQYAIHFDGDLGVFGLTSPVVLPSTSSGTVTLTAQTGGSVIMAWTGTSQLPNPFDLTTYIPFSYTCSVTAAFAPEPVTLLQLAMIPQIVNLGFPAGIESSLLTKLDTALDSVLAGRNRSAASTLNAFVNQIEAQRGRKVSDADADGLISDAEATIALLRADVTAALQQVIEIAPGKGPSSR